MMYYNMSRARTRTRENPKSQNGQKTPKTPKNVSNAPAPTKTQNSQVSQNSPVTVSYKKPVQRLGYTQDITYQDLSLQRPVSAHKGVNPMLLSGSLSVTTDDCLQEECLQEVVFVRTSLKKQLAYMLLLIVLGFLVGCVFMFWYMMSIRF